MLGLRWTRVGLMVVALAVAGAATPAVAQAQGTTATLNQIHASPKGTIGFAVLGAELGMGVPAAFGVDATWVYCVFPPAVSAGFAVMGHYLVDQKDITGLAVASLVLGMALVIPTVILTISAVRYDPADEFDVPEEEAAARHARRVARAGDGLLRWSEDGLLLGLPGVTPVRTTPDPRVMGPGAFAITEIRFSLVTGVF